MPDRQAWSLPSSYSRLAGHNCIFYNPKPHLWNWDLGPWLPLGCLLAASWLPLGRLLAASCLCLGKPWPASWPTSWPSFLASLLASLLAKPLGLPVCQASWVTSGQRLVAPWITSGQPLGQLLGPASWASRLASQLAKPFGQPLRQPWPTFQHNLALPAYLLAWRTAIPKRKPKGGIS